MRLFSTIDRLRRRHRHQEHSRGQSLVELALILPVLLVLIAATLDLGRVFYSQITIANAAREGAMQAADTPSSFLVNQACNKTTNKVMCRVINEAKGSFVSVAPTDVSLACTPACTTGIGNTVTVSVNGHFSLITPLLAGFLGGQNLTLTSTAAAQIVTEPDINSATSTATPTPTPAPTATATPAPTGTGTAAPTGTATPVPTVAPCFVPVAHFTVNPTSGVRDKKNRPGTVFIFTNTTTNMTAACNPIWSWTFGDGSGVSSAENPSYIYATSKTNPGYTVTLSASNTAGSNSYSIVIPVNN